MIVILHKDGDTNDLNNFHGITLLSMLGKLLIGVLNNRHQKSYTRKIYQMKTKLNFRKGYRTTDNIFTLLTLMNH